MKRAEERERDEERGGEDRWYNTFICMCVSKRKRTNHDSNKRKSGNNYFSTALPSRFMKNLQ